MSIPALATLATLFAARAGSAQPTLTPWHARVVRTIFEHQDHRMLPIGTRIYYTSGDGRSIMTYVCPGAPVPPGLFGRTPDVIVVSAFDPRGNDVRERTKPAQACCGAHLDREH